MAARVKPTIQLPRSLVPQSGVYRGHTYPSVPQSPSVDPHQSVDELVQQLQEVHQVNPSHLLICDDFNLPQIDWTNSFCSAAESHHAHKLLDAVHDGLLFQHITQPTRFQDGGIPSRSSVTAFRQWGRDFLFMSFTACSPNFRGGGAIT